MKLAPQSLTGVALAIVVLAPLSSWLSAQAQPTLSPESNPQLRVAAPPDLGAPAELRRSGGVRFSPPPPPPVDAPSGRGRGGASRGMCPNVTVPLTALVPPMVVSPPGSRKPLTKVWGLTTAAHPTFWFYSPYQGGYTAEFVLQDDDDNEVYRTSIVLPNQPGVLGIPLPEKVPPLLIGKSYRWLFSINCSPKSNSSLIFVEGGIQRVTLKPELAQQLEQATPQQQIELYAANGIWFNALTTLAELRRLHSQDASLTTDWMSLLRSVGLEEVAGAAIVK